MGIESNEPFRGRRIDSWKEIAAYFGRSERTVKRWEASRGLPVCRVPGGGKTSVYAYASELEGWLSSTGEPACPDLLAGPPASESPPPAPARPWTGLLRRPPRLALPALATIAFTIVAAAVFATGFATDRGSTEGGNAVASDLYLKGIYSWQTRTPAGLSQAVADFRKAIAADPHFAAAWAGLADCYSLMQEYTAMPAAVAFPKAREAALQAIRLDDNNAGAHRSLAFVDFWWSHDVDGAMREFRRALELDPNSAQTHHWFGNALGMLGDTNAALDQIRAAETLAPGITAIMADRGVLLVSAGRLGEAIQVLKQIETAEPGFAPAHAYLAIAYALTGDGAAELREIRWHGELRHDPGEVAVARSAAEGLAQGGQYEMRRRMVLAEQELAQHGRFSLYQLAIGFARLGDHDRALSCLDRAIRQRDPATIAMGVEPALFPLHGDARFALLMTLAGLPVPASMQSNRGA